MYISYVKYRNKMPDFTMNSSVSCKVTKVTNNILCVCVCVSNIKQIGEKKQLTT